MPWKKETLSGTLDGANKVFTMTETPMAESLMVFFPFNYCEPVGSQPQELQYSRSGTTVTFGLAPASGRRPWARYFYEA